MKNKEINQILNHFNIKFNEDFYNQILLNFLNKIYLVNQEDIIFQKIIVNATQRKLSFAQSNFDFLFTLNESLNISDSNYQLRLKALNEENEFNFNKLIKTKKEKENIVGVEVKSELDNLNRLKNQLIIYQSLCSESYVFCSTKHFEEIEGLIVKNKFNVGIILFDDKNFKQDIFKKENEALLLKLSKTDFIDFLIENSINYMSIVKKSVEKSSIELKKNIENVFYNFSDKNIKEVVKNLIKNKDENFPDLINSKIKLSLSKKDFQHSLWQALTIEELFKLSVLIIKFYPKYLNDLKEDKKKERENLKKLEENIQKEKIKKDYEILKEEMEYLNEEVEEYKILKTKNFLFEYEKRKLKIIKTYFKSFLMLFEEYKKEIDGFYFLAKQTQEELKEDLEELRAEIKLLANCKVKKIFKI